MAILQHDSITQPRRRKVSFDLDQNQNHVFSSPEDTVMADLWFTAEEFALIKATSKRECREWRRMGCSVLLDEIFDIYNMQAMDSIQAFVQLEDEETCRRGLERRCSQRHGETRYAYKQQSIQSVLFYQQRWKKQGMNHGILSQKLALAYSRDCHYAKVFAQRIAQADEMVALSATGTTNPTSILVSTVVPKKFQTTQQQQRRMSDVSASSEQSLQSSSSEDSMILAMRTKLQQDDGLKPRKTSSLATLSDKKLYAEVA
jgi:hypothetical protein